MKFFVVIFLLLSAPVYANFAEIRNSGSELDLMFVVDDSGSMTRFQERLKDQLFKLMEPYRKYSSLHVAIITTSTYRVQRRGKYIEYPQFLGSDLSGTFDEVMGRLSDELVVGVDGDFDEKPYKAIFDGLNSPLNKGFLRVGAKLKIILLTDEDDQSEMSSLEFIKKLKTIKNLNQINMTALIHDEKFTGYKCAEDSVISEGQPRIGSVVDFFDGDFFSICKDDWSEFSF